MSTDLKLSLVQAYLKSFTVALRQKFSQLWYIDAFAGTGERTVRLSAEPATLFDEASPERVVQRRGSAQIAIDTQPQFDRLIFMERKPEHYDALVRLAAGYPDRQIDVLQGNANDEIRRLLRSRNWKGTRAVMFLDPYGMSVEWSTLEEIRASEAIDVWYLVTLAGLFRQATLKESGLDAGKEAAITRMLGTDEWRTDWYQPSANADLFGHADGQRTASVLDIEAYVGKRLAALFPKVLPPLTLRNDRGAPMFSLFFAISNPEPKAIGLATRIANHILRSGKASHVRPR
ncbi:three-Cys-motif partner protein TcmP [Mongoliimonas terrestris]|uniref:three-Cys-motif partner protein TcmP n=1 Tax=Mongoliimonas terrestris TaxID=1709001 RepID=UPI001FDA0D1F|nr:three-Cys-motif partner protein TcmP [Mongoliimonas terrestris]